jgi:hypothetical protein
MKMRTSILTLGVFALLNAALFAQNTVTRTLPAFDKLAISGGYEKVVLKAGDAESVTIEADGINPDNVITEVKGNTLGIRMKKGSYRSGKIKISLTYRALQEVSNSSGDFTGAFDVKDLEINISGSSDMKLSGKADKQAIAISGSGDVDAQTLSGSEANVAISGSGDVSLHVSGPVQTAVSGSGKVKNQ